jgi:hypothetical protein
MEVAMIKFLRARRAALRGDTGAITVSIPELMVSMVVRIIIYAGLIASVAVLLLMWVSTTTSATSSASIQASSLRFNAAVANADIVRGSGTSTAALMTTDGASCDIDVWRSVAIGGVNTLVNETSTVAGVCTTATPIPASAAAGRNALLPNVTKVDFDYTNVGGREIVFTAAGNSNLTAGALPAEVASQDWEDTRPKHVTLAIETSAKGITTYAKNAKLAGSTNVVNYAEAKEGSKYVLPEPITVAPSALGEVWVSRSTTVGAVYGGVREGATVSFRGGICQDSASIVTITWTPISPAGQTPESSTFTRVMNGSPTVFDMPRVRNGSEGNMAVSVKCEVSADPESATTVYTQEVPDTQLTVRNGGNAESHDLSWTAVSSLPTTFAITYSSAPAKTGGAGSAGSTTQLSKTVTHAAGTTYGYATNYVVTPAVGAVDGKPQYGGTSNAWPSPPTATNIAYTHTGAGGRFTNGVITWGYSATCPTGTVLSAREVQDVVYDGNTGVATRGNFTVGTFGSKQSAPWTPSYALEGFPYEERIDVKCSSPVTGSQSTTSSASSGTFFTPMTAPSAPQYDGFDFRDYVRGDTTGYMTCYNISPNNCITNYWHPSMWWASYQLDYQTTCAPGSAVRDPRTQSSYTTIDWNGRLYEGWFGRQDGWQLPQNVNQRQIQHVNPSYVCSTLWQTSPRSAAGANITYTVNRIW